MRIITHELSKPISYAGGAGQLIECNHVDLVEPTGRVSHICNAIEGQIQTAILKMSESLNDGLIEQAQSVAVETQADDGDVKDGDGILAVMMGGGADMKKLTLLFRELFAEVALMGGEKKITSARLDDLAHKDLRAMMGLYAANFILS